MKTIGIIPARYCSSRFPGKPLADICGKSMIRRVYEASKSASLIDEVFVATDDERIATEVRSFGGNVVLTSQGHSSGTSRIAEAVVHLDAEIVINIQGDEPFIDGTMIDELADVMKSNNDIYMATMCSRLTEPSTFADENVVKVVSDLYGYALYFSRSVIPFPRNAKNLKIYEHIGIYGYTRSFLERYIVLEETPLCIAESLEQLKVLEHGYKIFLVETKYAHSAFGINTPEDLERARSRIKDN